MKKLFLLLFILCLSGCILLNPTVLVTKQYEGHFYTDIEAKAAIDKINLQKGESVWILSNETLKRVLKNNK